MSQKENDKQDSGRLRRLPVSEPGALMSRCHGEIMEAVERVLRSGRYVGGREVESFEASLAAYIGASHAVGVSNGLDALRLIFEGYKRLGRLKTGDRVIVPANTYIASALAVTSAGLEPVLVDANPATMNLDTDAVEAAIDSRTRAVMTVHLYGRCCHDGVLEHSASRHGLLVIEDVAQAIGAVAPSCSPRHGLRAGNLGDAAAFSFYPTKNLGGAGDAGAVVSSDAALVAAVRALANYGSDRRYHNIYQGFNCRLDPLQAAILSVRLGYVDEENRARNRIARYYMTRFANPAIITGADWEEGSHVFHQFVVRVTDNRETFRERLAQAGIDTDVHYPLPLYRQPCYEHEAWARCGDWPQSDMLARQVVSLPVSPLMTPDDCRRVAEAVNAMPGTIGSEGHQGSSKRIK